jgi:outer membrane protein assembly factor BamA
MRSWLIGILVVVVVLSRLPGQEAAPSPKASYDGQKVETVELVANPKISTDSLQPLVQQKAGQPYSSAKVAATMVALKGTGHFTKVDLLVKPGASGLGLTFTLEPALYIGILEFPGARQFTYTRLLQVVDIDGQTLFQPQLIDQARDALKQFFTKDGFFQAQVRPESSFDEAHMLANITFHIDLGRRAKIGQVEIRGADADEADKLLQSTRSLRARLRRSSLRPGQAYSSRRIDSAVSLIKRNLTGQRRLASKVRFDHANYHPDSNLADVIINAQPGPVVKINIQGAELSRIFFLRTRRMKLLIPIYMEGSVDADLVEEGRQNLIDFFQSKGYFNAQVTTDFHEQPSLIDLVYKIDTGRKHTVESIGFRGNTHFDANDLKPKVLVKKRRFLVSRGRFSNKLVRKSVNAITAFYRDHGYADVKVEPDVVDKEPRLYVTFVITEGPQTVVSNLTLRGNTRMSWSELTPLHGFELRPGQPFSPRALTSDRAHILASYLDHGFLNADLTSEVTKVGNHQVDVVYNITEAQQVRTQKVLTLGRQQTRESLIQKTARIAPETPLSQGALLGAELRLQDTGVFDWTNATPRRPITDQTNEDVLLKVHEAKRNEVTYGFGLEITKRGGNVPSGTIALPGLPPITSGVPNFTAEEETFVSPRGSIEFSRYNLRGLAETFSMSALLSRLDQQGVATYTQPQFRLSGWSSLFSASAERTTENPTFEARVATGTWQLEKPLNKDKTRKIQLRYSFSWTIVSNLLIPGLVLEQDQRVRLSALSATWIRDTRDQPLDASKGFYQTLDFRITPKVIGSNFDLARFLGQTAYYKSLGPTVWANRVMLGLVDGFAGSNVPTSELFFSGGDTTLRGFPIYGAGPQRIVPACVNPKVPSTCVNLTVPVGGRQLFIFNSEYRFPLGIKVPFFGGGLGGAVFYDGGNVYSAIGVSHFVANFTNTIGTGLRYRTPIGPVRFDFGHNLNPVRGTSPNQYYVTLGQAF